MNQHKGHPTSAHIYRGWRSHKVSYPLSSLSSRFSAMHFTLASSVLTALAASVAAQNVTFLTEVLQELQSLGLTSLANVSTVVNSTTTGQSLLSELGSGPQTIFAPNNDACKAFSFPCTILSQSVSDIIDYRGRCAPKYHVQCRASRRGLVLPRCPRLIQHDGDIPEHDRWSYFVELVDVPRGQQTSGSRLVRCKWNIDSIESKVRFYY